MKKVLLLSRFVLPVAKYLNKNYKIYNYWEVDPSIYADIDILVSSIDLLLTPELLVKFPKVKLISQMGMGYDNIDFDFTKSHNIQVRLVDPSIVTYATAELAVTLLLTVMRKIITGIDYIHENLWNNNGKLLGHGVYNKKIGIVGLGRIGSQIAKVLAALGGDICYFSRTEKKVDYSYYDNLNNLANDVSVLIMACPLNEATRNMVNYDVFKLLGSDGYFVNIARGAIVKEADLIMALQNNIIAGAGLDVFCNEPNINPKFLKLTNVVLQPHQGSATVATRDKMYAAVAKNIESD